MTVVVSLEKVDIKVKLKNKYQKYFKINSPKQKDLDFLKIEFC
jgi:hypothetical protein